MLFEIGRETFGQLVKHAARGLAVKSTFPEWNVLHLVGENGVFRVTGSSADTTCTAEDRNAECDTFHTAVSGPLLRSIASLLPDEPVLVEATEKTCSISCGKTVFRLPVIPDVSIVFDSPEGNTIPLDSSVRQVVKRLGSVAATDDTLPALTAFCVDPADSGLRLVATDRYRLGAMDIPVDASLEGRLLLRARDLLAALEPPGEARAVLATERNVLSVQCANNSLMFATTIRCVDGEYPPYEKLVEIRGEQHAVVDVHALGDAVQRAGAVIPKTRPVILEFGSDEITVSCETDDITVTQAVAAECEGKGFQVAVNPRYLRDALNMFDTDQVRIEYTDPQKPLAFRHVDQTSILPVHVLMPVRVSR